jgi:hypothetical protein
MPDLEVLLLYKNFGPELSHSLTAHGGLPKTGHHRVLRKKADFTALTPAVEGLHAHADNCLDFSRHQLSAPSTTAAPLGSEVGGAFHMACVSAFNSHPPVCMTN